MTENLPAPVNNEQALSLMDDGAGELLTYRDDTVIHLKEKGLFFIGKFLGLDDVAPKDKEGKALCEPFRAGRFAALQTNADSAVQVGEVCSIAASGLLLAILEDQKPGVILGIKFNGQKPGETKEGKHCMFNRWVVKNLTAEFASRGIS